MATLDELRNAAGDGDAADDRQPDPVDDETADTFVDALDVRSGAVGRDDREAIRVAYHYLRETRSASKEQLIQFAVQNSIPNVQDPAKSGGVYPWTEHFDSTIRPFLADLPGVDAPSRRKPYAAFRYDPEAAEETVSATDVDALRDAAGDVSETGTSIDSLRQ